MNNKPHSEETKRKISESQRERWAQYTPTERAERGEKLKRFWAYLNSKDREKEDKVYLERHKQYIWEEFNRLFGAEKIY